MNAQEEKFFKKLSEIRHAQRKLLDSYALRGVEKSVVDKYSDEAHFIYELLQNADDACATEVSFKLEKDKLLFFHNGTRHFTLSNPETEDEDFKNGTIGDINAITAIGGSNKNNESTIGKFGVGFKAVFQYTKTPQIYDPVFHFKIDDFIVPVLIDHDYKDRSGDITLFIFPFNRYDRSAAACYSDIKYKLINLDYPMLFLNNIRNIDYSVDNKNYTYSKNINSQINFNDITAQLIKLEHLSSSASADDSIHERLWLFTRITTTNLKYSIGFFIDNTVKLIKKSHPAFCYFPTKEQTNLNFIIHAPFLLTDSREGIRAGEKHNIKKTAFLEYNILNDKTIYRGKGTDIYFPSDTIKRWFIAKNDVKYLCLDTYENIVGDESKKYLYEFFNDLGVEKEPRLLHRQLSSSQAYEINNYWPRSTRSQEWDEYYIDGSDELLSYIGKNLDQNASLILWHRLLNSIKINKFDEIAIGRYHYFYRSCYYQSYQSYFLYKLIKSKWLIDSNNVFVSPSEVSFDKLNEIYKTDTFTKQLCEKLGIPFNEEIKNINIDVDNSVENYGKSLGLSVEEQRIAFEEYANRKAIQTQAPIIDLGNSSHLTFDNSNITNYSEDDVLGQAARKLERMHKKSSTNHSAPRKDTAREDFFTELDEDMDEYIPPSTNLGRKMDQVKRDAVKELENLAELENLQKQLAKTQQYTFGWLQTLLELESREIGQNLFGNREISISFGKIERDEGTQRTLILKQPSRYIPQMMEDLTDIPLELNFANGESLKLPIEVINIKSYTLRIKVRPGVDLIGIPFEQVTSAHIEAQSPTFLFAELRKSIFKLAEDAHWTENFNIRDNLVKNMDFVFGPPGTGKSTWLANHILDLVTSPEQHYSKILVLAPTNKAADVLVRRVLACLPQDSLIPEWLVRFGVTGDNEIEQKGILKPKNFDIRKFPTIVTVTTIARFPYDYFLLNETTRLPLKSVDWDYVIIDEASMIHLPYIIYPLCKSKPKKFIIAGDPFQIQPIASIDTWKNENIYTLVGLNSFSQPDTLPVAYNVHCLTTQYRALPKIGELFSKFTYDNILIHYRNENSAIPIPYNSKIAINSLNIVKFPVRKYESIYRPQRLKGSSPYHIYSAIFSFELVKYLSSLDWQRTESGIFRIGVIAPYRAQADIVAKLVEGTTFPDKIDIQVGTIHGFQGDECEIILALFNPPPYISTSGNTFLNNRNIINVAISRARDYLFIVMPDDETIGVDDLHLIKNIESLCISQGCNIIESMDIENSIFGKRTYLEDNSFTTSHQDVNVYRTPELKYEIRCESMAIDLQIHNDTV